MQKQKWTKEEEAALKAGVRKHGHGKWKNILTDPDFSDALTNRSNVDLKDKWRNLGIVNLPLASKNNNHVLAITCGSHATPQNTNNALSLVAASDTTNTHKTPLNSVTKSIIFKAISSINDSKGSDFNAIASFIEQRHMVPYNFRGHLSSMIGSLTQQGRLKKVGQCYKIKKSGSSAKKPSPRSRDMNPGTRENFDGSNLDTLEAATKSAAFWLVQADYKSFLAAEAVEEEERVNTMVEESENILNALKGFFNKYNL
ncbi:telomere repeat-binding factor 4-like [Apium graveolens]|uniref:telomere repeat-binding factor 4-like n=1 Tax=Apium graveolens TaxID=4045 RepID=UPI003D79E3EF